MFYSKFMIQLESIPKHGERKLRHCDSGATEGECVTDISIVMTPVVQSQ